MFKTKKTTPKLDKKDEILESYHKISDKLYYKNVDLKKINNLNTEINIEIPLLNKSGISIFLVDDKVSKLFLSPGLDPYQARKDIAKIIERKANNIVNKTTSVIKKNSKKSSGIKVTKTISI
jgi:hypothetical protein